METILATAFGYKVEILRGGVQGGDKLIEVAARIFDDPPGRGPITEMLVCLNCEFLIVCA